MLLRLGKWNKIILWIKISHGANHSSWYMSLVTLENPGHPKVGYFGLSFVVEKDVGRLHIPVDYRRLASTMKIFQACKRNSQSENKMRGFVNVNRSECISYKPWAASIAIWSLWIQFKILVVLLLPTKIYYQGNTICRDLDLWKKILATS